MHYRVIASPVGPLLLAGRGTSLTEIRFESEGRGCVAEPGWHPDAGALDEVVAQLEAYFAGALRQFSLTLEPGGTEFQRRVWDALQTIPFGETISYGELARRLGKPNASRAVGAANGANPIPIVVPCHRVIGADGSLTGFGGGVDIKRRLLAFEAEHGARDLFA